MSAKPKIAPPTKAGPRMKGTRVEPPRRYHPVDDSDVTFEYDLPDWA